MIIASFLGNNIDEKSRIFEITSLLADISIGIAFEIFFFILSIIEIDFND